MRESKSSKQQRVAEQRQKHIERMERQRNTRSAVNSIRGKSA